MHSSTSLNSPPDASSPREIGQADAAPFENGGLAVESIRLDGIYKDYSRGKVAVPVLKGVSLEVQQGEMVALMGSSGSGKTTLINLLGSLDRPTAGRYWLDGEEVSDLPEEDRAVLRSQKIGFVFQNFNLLPRLTALENVLMPLTYAHASAERGGVERARSLLQRVGLGGRLDHEPAQLSGGEQQRVAIARALINNCSLLIADEPTGNLDSRTGEEILALFRQLNAEDGLTNVLVTHDPYVATHADRTIRMRDGVVYDDGEEAAEPLTLNQRPALAHSATPPDSQAAKPLRHSSRPIDARGPGGIGFLFRTMMLSFRSLRRNALRSALTTLGVIIGVASLISIAEVGKGAWTAIRVMLTKTGVDNILVKAGAASSNGVSMGSGSIKTLTPEDAEAILRECPSVDSLAPMVYTRQQVIRGTKNWVPANFYGTTPGFLRVRDWQDLEEGEAFTDQDVRDIAMVCLLGQTLVDELFGDESPIGREVYVNDVPLRVIGVLRRKGADIIGEDQDDILLAPWTTIKFRISTPSLSSSSPAVNSPTDATDPADLLSRRYPRTHFGLYPTQSAAQAINSPRLERFANVDSILVRAPATHEIPAAMAQITALLRERHRIAPGEPDDFAVLDFTEVVDAVKATVGLVAGLLVCVALISLLVGGVGIMNIMLVSVTERYREIGLRMAVGARPNDILRQFLVEAVVLCVLGGAVGILVGRGASILVRVLAAWPTEPSLLAILGSVSVSITVGVIFGYYPAWKASRLNPIEALRSE
jgi:macrolide transport system ATP-binding/permease protein